MNAPVSIDVARCGALDQMTVGLIRLANLTIAMPVERIREMVARPTNFEPAPGPRGLIVGAIILRGTIIPVVDLAQALGAAADPSDDCTMVVIVHMGQQLIGVLANGPEGVHSIGTGLIQPMNLGTVDIASRLLVGSFVLGAALVYLLDPNAIADLPGVWMTSERPRSGETESRGQQFLTIRISQHIFAIDIGVVRAVLPKPDILPPPCDIDGWEGFVTYLGCKVALVRSHWCLGIGDAEGDVKAALILQMSDNCQIALIIDQVCALERFAIDTIRPMPPLVSLHPEFFLGVQSKMDGDHYYVIDPRMLSSDDRVASLMRVSDTAGQVRTSTCHDRTSPATGVAHLLVEMDWTCAVPLHQISQVNAFPHHVRALPDRERWLIGECAQRDVSLPIIDLACLLGMQPTTLNGHARLLIVEREGRSIALAVNGLRNIIVGRREAIGTRAGFAIPDLDTAVPEAVLVQSCARRGMYYPVLDIEDLLRRHALF